MKFNRITSLFSAKSLVTAWLVILILTAVLSAVSFFNATQTVSEPNHSSLLQLGTYILLFVIIAFVGIAIVLKKSAGGGSKRTIARLQEYIENPNAFRQGLKHDGNGKQADLFELIDLVILNATNKLDRVEDAGSILAGAASEISYDAKYLSDEMKKQNT